MKRARGVQSGGVSAHSETPVNTGNHTTSSKQLKITRGEQEVAPETISPHNERASLFIDDQLFVSLIMQHEPA